MQYCPICRAKCRVFFNFVAQSSHKWHCPDCAVPLTFQKTKNTHGLMVLLFTTGLLYLVIRYFSSPAMIMLVVGLPLIIAFDFLRYLTIDYVSLDRD